MSSESIPHLLNFFRELITTEQTANAVKGDLISLPSYKLRLLFEAVSGKSQSISIKSLKKFLEGKLACNDRELYDVFERIDHRRCGLIFIEDMRREI
jgi:hypothetical protein